MPFDSAIRLGWFEVAYPTTLSVQDSYQGNCVCRSTSLSCDRLQHLVVVDSGIHLQLFVQVAPISTHPLAVVEPAPHAETCQGALPDVLHAAYYKPSPIRTILHRRPCNKVVNASLWQLYRIAEYMSTYWLGCKYDSMGCVGS